MAVWTESAVQSGGSEMGVMSEGGRGALERVENLDFFFLGRLCASNTGEKVDMELISQHISHILQGKKLQER